MDRNKDSDFKTNLTKFVKNLFVKNLFFEKLDPYAKEVLDCTEYTSVFNNDAIDTTSQVKMFPGYAYLYYIHNLCE